MSLLSIKDLNTWYGTFQALFDVSISIERGETVALIGANGAGKSTLLGTIMGLRQHKAAEFRFNESDVSQLEVTELAQRGISIVPEGRRLFADLTVRENLLIGEDLGRKGDWTLEKVQNLFPILGEFASRPAGLLSGGQQQMVSIGRALLTNPELLLIDEASLGLAPVVVDDVYQALGQLRGKTSIIIVEQDIYRAISFADRFWCLRSGEITLGGACETADLKQVSAAYFGEDAA